MEGLGYGGSDQGLLFSINAHMWTNSIPLLKYGTGIKGGARFPFSLFAGTQLDFTYQPQLGESAVMPLNH
jgi:hypothetical protein